jgi:uncharacterized protein YcbX
MYLPDIAGADPGGRRDKVVAQKLGAARFESLGKDSPVAAESFFDVFPLSLLTTSTLWQLREVRPGSRFEARRFRMNVVVWTEEEGFVENGWVGRAVGLGEGARVQVTVPDARCVMTTLGQGDLPEDTEVLRALVERNRVDQHPCAGVYGVVAAPGHVRVGDEVTIA